MSTQEQAFTIEELQAQLLSAVDSGDRKKVEEIASQLDAIDSISSNNDINELQLKLLDAHDSGNVAEVNKLAEILEGLEPQTQTQTQTLQQVVEEESYIIDQTKGGVSDFILDMLPDRAFGIDGLDSKYFNSEKGITSAFNRELYQRDLAKAKDDVRKEFFDYKGVKPKSNFDRYIGAGARATVSEGPLAFIGARGPTTAVVELLHSFAASTLGVIGGDTAAEAAETLGFGEYGQNIARGLGSFISGTTTSLARIPASVAIEGAGDVIQRKRDAMSAVENATERLAIDDVDGIIKAATKAQPDLDDFINKTVELQETIPGLVIPPGAILADNPIIVKNLDRLLKTNPEFFADMRLKVKDGMDAVKTYRQKMFGEGGQTADARLKAAIKEDSGINLKNINKRIDAIDKQIEKRVSVLESAESPMTVGKNVKNLMRAKEAAVKKKLAPRYSQVLRKAELEGIEMAPSSVENIYETVRLQKLEDIFGVEPRLAKLVKQEFSPKQETIDPNILLPGGIKQKPKTVLSFKPASIKTVDSLKRNLNSAIRKTSDPDSKRKLIELKKQFQAEMDLMPESFVKNYRKVDNDFYEELGIKQSSASLKELDAKRFEAKVGEYLTDAEHARDFIAFTGDKGVPVVRDAVLLKIENQAFKDGEFDSKKFANFMRNRKNKELIDEVPGLRAELESGGAAIRDMLEVKGRLNTEFTEKSVELTKGLFSSVKNKSFNKVINEIIESPKTSKEYLEDIKNFSPDTAKMLKQGIRAGFLEQAMKSNGSVLDFITDNKIVFTQWFGPRYLKNVTDMAEVSDILSKVSLNERFAIDFRDADALARATNMSFPEAQSLLRDRITNLGTKFAIAISKITSRSADAKRDGHLMELLSNPENMQAITNEIKRQKLSQKPLADVAADSLAAIASKTHLSIFKGAYFGLKGSETYERMEEESEMAVNQ